MADLVRYTEEEEVVTGQLCHPTYVFEEVTDPLKGTRTFTISVTDFWFKHASQENLEAFFSGLAQIRECLQAPPASAG